MARKWIGDEREGEGMKKLTNWKECVEALLAGKTLEYEPNGNKVFMKECGDLSTNMMFGAPYHFSIAEPTVTITESEMRDALSGECDPQGKDIVLARIGFGQESKVTLTAAMKRMGFKK